MKNTWIVTMEVTLIDDRDLDPNIETIKYALNADDVVITKTQLFEGADEDAHD